MILLIQILTLMNKNYFGGNMAAKKKMEGVELANDIMLNELAAFMVSKKCYGKLMPKELQMVQAKKDVLNKNGKLRKFLAINHIFTKYDLAFKCDSSWKFFDFTKVVQAYRTQVIKKSFAHRADECK